VKVPFNKKKNIFAATYQWIATKEELIWSRPDYSPYCKVEYKTSNICCKVEHEPCDFGINGEEMTEK